MRLTVIGCSGSFPGPDSPASCYLLEAPYAGGTYRLLLDLGSGALGALQRYVQPESIDVVCLTHLHPDHCMDMCGFYVLRKYHPGGPLSPISVYGPDGTADRLARAYDLDVDPGMTREFDFEPYREDPFDLGPFTLAVTQVDHPVPTFAIRVTHGDRSLVYSGDTGPCTSLEQIAKDCDVLLAEASFLEPARHNPPNLHLTGRQAAETAERAGVGRLILTHIPPWHVPGDVLAEAAPHFSGVVTLASAGASYDV
jgi:ribonuclease BN (tRNA processing enzyme)